MNFEEDVAEAEEEYEDEVGTVRKQWIMNEYYDFRSSKRRRFAGFYLDAIWIPPSNPTYICCSVNPPTVFHPADAILEKFQYHFLFSYFILYSTLYYRPYSVYNCCNTTTSLGDTLYSPLLLLFFIHININIHTHVFADIKIQGWNCKYKI